MKSMNRMKVIRRITTLVMLFIIIFCFAVTGFDMNVIINRGSQAVLFIKRMFPPDTGYCGKVIEPLIKTVQMSIAGTFIGAVFGLFTAFLYAGQQAGLYTCQMRGIVYGKTGSYFNRAAEPGNQPY